MEFVSTVSIHLSTEFILPAPIFLLLVPMSNCSLLLLVCVVLCCSPVFFRANSHSPPNNGGDKNRGQMVSKAPFPPETNCSCFFQVHQLPGLISIYLAGEDKSTKHFPATTESTILLALMLTSSIPTTAMFLLLDEFHTFCGLKSGEAS